MWVQPRRSLLVVVAVAVVSVALRLWIAATTFGSDDVRYWTQFAAGVRRFGPTGIYGHHFLAQYNHPPLTGWLLSAIDHLAWTGLSIPLLVRVPACLADGVTGVLLFLLLARFGDRRTAVPAAVVFLLSPVAVIVSGFHGNTDPVFVMLCLAALHEEKAHRRHLTAGVLLALAISVKIVPIILLPVFVLQIVSDGSRGRWRFLSGGALVFVVLWVPALLSGPAELVHNVLFYAGNGMDMWGLPVVGILMGVDPIRYQALIHASSYLALVAAAVVPVVIGRRVKGMDLPRVGLCMGLFLLLSPAFGMQYLVWPLAVAFLVSFRWATVYAAAASAFALTVYSLWAHAMPWNWYEVRSFPLPDFMVALMLPTWLALLTVVLRGVDRLRCPGGVSAAGITRLTSLNAGSSVRSGRESERRNGREAGTSTRDSP
jgi:hypothetical protein